MHHITEEVWQQDKFSHSLVSSLESCLYLAIIAYLISLPKSNTIKVNINQMYSHLIDSHSFLLLPYCLCKAYQPAVSNRQY